MGGTLSEHCHCLTSLHDNDGCPRSRGRSQQVCLCNKKSTKTSQTHGQSWTLQFKVPTEHRIPSMQKRPPETPSIKTVKSSRQNSQGSQRRRAVTCHGNSIRSSDFSAGTSPSRRQWRETLKPLEEGSHRSRTMHPAKLSCRWKGETRPLQANRSWDINRKTCRQGRLPGALPPATKKETSTELG